LLLGVLLRLNLSVKAFFSTFDTSTVGLMAMHILEGERPLFYYGQDYMGALEAYVAAVMFFLFGVSTTALSLAPILFAAGWIFAMYHLFSELLGFRAGLAAALCTAAGGWYTMWFSMGSYGGYSNTFFFGTVFLALSVRLAGRDLSAAARWIHAVAMGIVAALGVWTNLQVFSYLVTGGLVLVVGMVPAAARRVLVKPVLAAAVLSLAGFIPLLLTKGGFSVGPGDLDGPSLAAVSSHARLLLRRLPKLLLWPVDTPGLLLKGAIASWLIGVSLYVVKLLTERRKRERLRLLVPLLFACVFLVLYLVHPLAAMGAPRYLVPLASMVTAAVFGAAVSHRWRAVRWAGYVFLAIWTLFNTASVLQTAEAKAGKKRDVIFEREGIIRQAEEEGLRHLMILGSHTDGHNGQSLTFYARDRVRYVSSTLERYYPAALSAEIDPETGLVFKGEHLRKVRRSLRSAGITSYGEARFRWTTLYDLKVPRAKSQSVLPEEMKVEVTQGDGSGADLVDRRAGTGIETTGGKNGERTVTAMLDRPRRIGALRLTADNSGRLPDSFKVSTSMDGINYAPAGPPSSSSPPTYVCGNRVYMMGYYARVDLRFSPVKARFVRIEIGRGKKRNRPWAVNELFLIESTGASGAVTDEEVEEIARILKAETVDFTVADRWMSARLGVAGEGLNVYPLFNPRHRHTIADRRFAPRPGLAVVVESAMAEESERLLERANSRKIPMLRTDLAHYTIFLFTGPGGEMEGVAPSLEWNGHAVLAARSSGGAVSEEE
jgi:hypothetical protein